MALPLQITIRGMDHTPAVDAHIREQAEHLSPWSDRISHCHVTVEAPGQHHQHGAPFRVVVNVDGAEKPIVARAEPAEADFHRAVRDAFHVARRQLVDAGGRRRREARRV